MTNWKMKHWKMKHWKMKCTSVVRRTAGESGVSSGLLYRRTHTVRLNIVRYLAFHQQRTDRMAIQDETVKNAAASHYFKQVCAPAHFHLLSSSSASVDALSDRWCPLLATAVPPLTFLRLEGSTLRCKHSFTITPTNFQLLRGFSILSMNAFGTQEKG